MGYSTPKTDWDASDYFNVEDWERVYRNSQLASYLSAIMLDAPIAFTPLTLPATNTNPQTALSKLNTILANIEATRVAMAAELPLLSDIKDDWEAGRDAHSPDYVEANQWENTIDAIWDYWNGDSLDVCPILSSNLTIPTGTQYVVVDCIDPGNFEIIIEGTGELFVL